MKKAPDARPAMVTMPWVVRCASGLTERDQQIALHVLYP